MWDRAMGERMRRSPRRGCRPRFESLEGRELLTTASLASIGTVSVPTTLGYQLPLNGTGGGQSQTYTATSSNPDVKVSVATGQFLTLAITHTPAQNQPNDPVIASSITLQLFGDLTPNTVNEIVSLISSGFYTEKAATFNRIANGFPTTSDYIVQGGSITGTTAGNSNQPGTPFVDEFNPQLAFTSQGLIAMANSGPDTNDTQFFITTSANPTIDSYRSLDFGYTIFGAVVADPDNTLAKLRQVAVNPSTNQPLNPVNFVPTLSTTNPNGVLHIDAVGASAGETSTITVTATDPSSNTTATQTFNVNVIANNNSSGTPVVEKPYLQRLPYPTTVINPTGSQPVVVYQQSVGLNQSDIFQVQGYAATPGDKLTYVVKGGVTTDSSGNQVFTDVQNVQSATVDANGVVTVVPKAGFSGTIDFLVAVRDQTNRAGTTSLDSPANFDWHKIRLTVNSSSTPVPLTPIAAPFTATAVAGTPQTIQLQGQSANPATSTGLTYTLVSQPSHGTISSFNASTGKLVYTPTGNFTGSDTFQYTVTDHGTGNTSPTSPAGTVTVDVSLANTDAVRVIGTALVVTPKPRTDKGTNTILVSEDDSGALVVTVNGTIDADQPSASDIDRIVVFGAKASDKITIDPSVDPAIAVTLDGGHGGVNVLRAGDGPTREHGWFGRNRLIGGTGPNQLIGRAGSVRFRPTSTTTEIFAGVPHGGAKDFVHHRDSLFSTYRIQPPGGTFFAFVNGHLVPSSPARQGALSRGGQAQAARHRPHANR